jgi:hypothetical protein
MQPTEPRLEQEARVFGRYLVDATPAPSVVARYRDAVSTLWPSPPPPRDAALLAFVRRHPWSVGPLDAAAGLVDRGGQLRSRILLAGAILETTTTHADDFLPRTVATPALLGRLVASGISSALLAVAGMALWPIATRTDR